MLFNSYSNSSNNNKKKSQILFNKKNVYRDFSYNNPFSKSLKSHNLASSTTKINNYINYTFSDKNNKYKYFHKVRSTKNNQKILLMQKKYNKTQGLKIINNFPKTVKNNSSWSNFKYFKENDNNYNMKNPMNFMNKDSKIKNNNNIYINEEFHSRNNISKISGNKSIKNLDSFIQSKIEANDFLEIYKDRYKENEALINLVNENIKRYHKIKVNSVLNSSIPIKKKINILKEAKSSIEKMKKNKMNTSSSFRGFLDDSNQSKLNNYSSEKSKYFNDISSYYYKDYYDNKFANKRPIIIKYMPKPKLSVPKFININNIEIS
jgi:hypothetical protein